MNCPDCGAFFSKRIGFHRHWIKVHENENSKKPPTCEMCNKKFSRKDKLLQHLRNLHFIGKSSEHECQLCGFKTAYKHNLKKHLVGVHGTNDGVTFTRKHEFRDARSTSATNLPEPVDQENGDEELTCLLNNLSASSCSSSESENNMPVFDHIPVGIEAWLEEMRSSTTTLVDYKPLGLLDLSFPELTRLDFILIFMTDTQKEILKKNGSDLICIEATRHYNFQLFTVLTIDKSSEGFPVAFMFTNRFDEIVLSSFLQKIKDFAGPISPRVFMSDVGDTSWLAWTKVMGSCPYRLYCSGHVLKEWKVNLMLKVINKEKQRDVLKTLHMLMYELEITTFQKTLKEVVDEWNKHPATKCFVDYFTEHYGSPSEYKKWAYCYHIKTGVNTNMSMEIFNKFLYHCYLKGENIDKKLDGTFLLNVLRLIKDKLFDHMMKLYKRKVAIKLHNLRSQHKLSVQMKQDHVLKNGDVWQVLSSGSEQTCIVVKVKDCKEDCVLLCTHCKSCFHEFACSCPDNTFKNNMCVHIHLVAPIEKSTSIMQQPDIDLGTVFVVNTLNDEDINVETVLTDFNVPTHLVLNDSFQEKKRRFIDKFLEFSNFFEENVTNSEQLEYVEQYWDEIQPTLAAVTLSRMEVNDSCSNIDNIVQ